MTWAHLIRAQLWYTLPLPVLKILRPRPKDLAAKPCNNVCNFAVGAVLRDVEREVA